MVPFDVVFVLLIFTLNGHDGLPFFQPLIMPSLGKQGIAQDLAQDLAQDVAQEQAQDAAQMAIEIQVL